jgi:hypothetical protein
MMDPVSYEVKVSENSSLGNVVFGVEDKAVDYVLDKTEGEHACNGRN